VIETRGGAKNLFPEKPGVLRNKTNLTTSHRFVIFKNFKDSGSKNRPAVVWRVIFSAAPSAIIVTF